MAENNNQNGAFGTGRPELDISGADEETRQIITEEVAGGNPQVEESYQNEQGQEIQKVRYAGIDTTKYINTSTQQELSEDEYQNQKPVVETETVTDRKQRTVEKRELVTGETEYVRTDAGVDTESGEQEVSQQVFATASRLQQYRDKQDSHGEVRIQGSRMMNVSQGDMGQIAKAVNDYRYDNRAGDDTILVNGEEWELSELAEAWSNGYRSSGKDGIIRYH